MENFISSYIIGTNLLAYVGINHGTRYLNSNLHYPIINPRGTDLDGTNLLWFTYDNGKFDE